MSTITSIATGVPEHRYLQASLSDFAIESFAGDPDDERKLRFLYKHSGITARHSILNDFSLPVGERTFFADGIVPDIGKRMALYETHAAPLSAKTIADCIDGFVSPAEVTHLITVSCTGMSAPGLDLQVAELLDLRHDIVRSSVNFMGCYAAVHAMKLADAFCRSSEHANVVVVCTEFCSLHFQQDNTVDNLTSSLIFADGCAAFLMQTKPAAKGINIESFYSEIMPRGKKDMAWAISSTGFEMTLSAYIPDLIKSDFEKLTKDALRKLNLQPSDISHWCIHPGGKKILEVIAEVLKLSPKQLHFSYQVLNDFGNMSSPTILFVLQKILEDIIDNNVSGNKIFGAAFGPGLTMETFTASYG